MSGGVWLGTILLTVVLALALDIVRTERPNTPPPLSEHARPAVRIPVGAVAVNEDGKTFHTSDCRYIHGKKQATDANAAVQEGYVPWIRCEQRALRKRG